MKVIINTDCSLKLGDPVDDLIALILAFRKLKVVGVVTTDGIERKELVAKNVETIARLCDVDVWVGYGEEGKNIIKHGLSKNAVFVSIAPLTPYMDFSDKIRTIFIMGGVIKSELNIVFGNRKNRAAEFNIWKDIEAAKRVISGSKTKYLLPVDTCTKLPITKEFIAEIRNEFVKKLLMAHKRRFSVDYLYDPLLVSLLIDRDIINTAEVMKIDINDGGVLTRGKHRVNVITDVLAHKVYSLIIEVLNQQ